MTNAKLLCAVVVGSISLIACSKQGSSQEPENAYTASNAATSEPALAPDPVATAPSADPALEPGPIGATGPAPATAAAPPAANPAPAAPLTDGQILKVAEAVDKGEIDQSKEVQKKARDPQVKKLAAHMIQAHTKSRQKGETLGKKAQLTPEDSPVLNELSAKAEANLQTLKTATDAKDAERLYLDAQMRQHETVLELLNTRLIPSASNPDLKAQLEEVRKMVETHIEETRKVQQAISDTSATPTPPSG